VREYRVREYRVREYRVREYRVREYRVRECRTTSTPVVEYSEARLRDRVEFDPSEVDRRRNVDARCGVG
jgi:hypothetical protein